MKKILYFFSALLLLAVAVIVASCSGDEETINHRKLIIGKWKQVRQGNIDMTDRNIILHFRNDGKVEYSFNLHANGETNTSNPKVSSYVFEDDWNYDEGRKVLEGHLSFLMHEELGTNVPDRFRARVDRDRLVLTPDMGIYYFVDPTMYFERTK